MYAILKQNREKAKYFILFTTIIAFALLLTVTFKNDQEIKSKEINIPFKHENLTSIKEFLLTLIKSPFTNVNYEIKNGDSIQKILKKFKVQNKEIQAVIRQYKKYSNPNQLLTGTKIEIVIEENLSQKNYSIVKFSIPVSKSTTIEITKDERDKIASKKIITKLYKKRILAENVIKNNLYTSAVNAKINPEAII